MKKIMTFNDKFQMIVESEQKQKTTRLITTDDFCYYERFMYHSHMYEIDHVERMSIRESCDTYYRDEMFESSDDMYNELVSIYKTVNEDSKCFVVTFHKVY